MLLVACLAVAFVACSAPRSQPRSHDGAVNGETGGSAGDTGGTGGGPGGTGSGGSVASGGVGGSGTGGVAGEGGMAGTPDASFPGAEAGVIPDGGAPDMAPGVDVPVTPPPDSSVPPDTGIAKLANGAACSAASACASNFCVDGVCCESACGGQCEACAQPNNAGKCVAVTGPAVGARPACAGQGTCGASCNGVNRQSCSYPASEKECATAACTANTAYSNSVCDGKGACLPQTTVSCGAGGCSGTICAGGCSASNPCTAGQFCDAGKCFPKKSLGAACTSADACSSGNCVDGSCCNSTCDGACQSCTTGTCTPVKNADDDKCIGGKTCDASGACKARAGSDCSSPGDCATGNCVDGKCCTASACGACQACTGGGGQCVSVTNKDDDGCTGTCDASGACKSKQGQACGPGCIAGTTCADGVCCDQACSESCKSCNQAGNVGKCMPVSGTPTGGRSCGSGTCGGMCTGAANGACSYPSGNCGAGPTCSSGTFTGQSTCMNGTCVAPTPQSCPMGCTASGCSSGCTTNADCTAPLFCSSGSCVKPTQIVCGQYYSCALISDGSVRCWGYNENGQLGDGTTVLKNPHPVKVANLTGAIAISSGQAHTCALFVDGSVKCWGQDYGGNLGFVPSSGTSARTPSSVEALIGASQISAGSANTYALMPDGTIKSWGANGVGELGNGTSGVNTKSYSPVAVMDISGAVAVIAGGSDAFAIMPGTVAKAWGANNDGRLGTGTYSTAVKTPVSVAVSNVVAISAGTQHTCAAISGGTVKCWGNNSFCQIGNGACGSNVPTPTTVMGLTTAGSIVAAGLSHSCAIMADATVTCWGGGFAPTPSAIAGLTGVTGLCAGSGHSCALTSTGAVKCWGGNDQGQLGDGTTMNSTMPVTVVW